jgi:mannosylglycoprotein endo-beta-mannosidase
VGDGRGFARLNRALITLIPKKPEAIESTDFRPISLVHSFAKLFSKVVANRLRSRLGEMVSMNQSAFIKHRSLHDNFVLVRQVARKINSRRNTGVLLKLDLARAFDSLSWSFLFEVLRRMGFGERFLKWIALLLYTANTRVLVNGVPGDRIVHARGLRQGDPTSPMLFVAAMEVLSATIKKAVEGDMFSNLAGISPLQRISIYADDVVLFFKPERREMLVTKHILQIFGEASGLKVNFRKTTATLIRGSREQEEELTATLGCELARFPIKYLGLQLALRPLTKAEWQPLLDRVIKCVPAWQRGLIKKEGRLVLINSVVSARAVHQLVVAEAPMWLLEEINRWMRAFFWAGKDRVTGGKCLVAWESMCKPKEVGGLGIKCLRLQGLALRLRWLWLRRTDPDRPWQGLPGLGDKEAEEAFRSLSTFCIGDGRNTFFWRDCWVNGFTVEELAPELCAKVPTRRKNARTVAEAMENNQWLNDITEELTVEEGAQCIRVWEAIDTVQRDDTRPDHIIWKGSATGDYTPRSTYEMLCKGSTSWSMSSPVWKSFAPVKCKIFIWLALKYRLWTSDRRARHGLQEHTDPCYTCLQEEDTVDHILTQCPYTRQVWFEVLRSAGLNIQEPDLEANLERWWTEARKRVRKLDRKRFDSMIIITAWTLWKQRNSRVFGNVWEQKNPTQILEAIKEEFLLWERARSGGSAQIARE